MSLNKYKLATLFLTLISFNVIQAHATYTVNADGWVETITSSDGGICVDCDDCENPKRR